MITHDEYAVGDTILVDIGSEVWVVDVDGKKSPIKRDESGWFGTVVETRRGRDTEPGDSKWGYDDQIVEVID